MKSTRANLIAASVIALGMMASAASPALAKCTKKNPLFGFEYYVADKHCPKAKVMQKVVNKTTPNKVVEKKTPAIKTATKLPAADPGVKEVQVLLAQAGYKPGPADGVKGGATTRALNNFRETLGLPSSTSHGNLMLALKRAAASNVSATKKKKAKSSKKADIKVMQMQLAKLGYEPGPADGVSRPATANALGYFRQNYGVPHSAPHNEQMAALERISSR
ncbi:MAG: peptidoglycan-binding protein [Hyphomicrobiaceae bacterium]|nr:peptidoglycan-binding protein [Hyphomicrobiaceae bacterium]